MFENQAILCPSLGNPHSQLAKVQDPKRFALPDQFTDSRQTRRGMHIAEWRHDFRCWRSSLRYFLWHDMGMLRLPFHNLHSGLRNVHGRLRAMEHK